MYCSIIHKQRYSGIGVWFRIFTNLQFKTLVISWSFSSYFTLYQLLYLYIYTIHINTLNTFLVIEMMFLLNKQNP